MRIGDVSLWWPPVHGGAEIYADRLSCQLSANGVDVCAITGTAASSDTKANGKFNVVRVSGVRCAGNVSHLNDFYLSQEYYSRIEEVIQWLKARRISHVLMSHPHDDPATAAFIPRLREGGRRVALIIHSASNSIIRKFFDLCWLTRGRDLVFQDLRLAVKQEPSKCLTKTAPQLSECEAIITTAEWHASVLNQVKAAPVAVFHPPLHIESSEKHRLNSVSVFMLNTLPHKGMTIMANVIIHSRPSLTFRVHQGGYGESAGIFEDLIWESPSISSRVALVEYIEPMRDFSSATKLVIFPTRWEGYGMTGVEALYCETPVIATDLPRNREGVGDGGMLVRWEADTRTLIESIETVLSNRPVWSTKARKRADFLNRRERLSFLI